MVHLVSQAGEAAGYSPANPPHRLGESPTACGGLFPSPRPYPLAEMSRSLLCSALRRYYPSRCHLHGTAPYSTRMRRGPMPNPSKGLHTGTHAPDFALTATDGTTVRLSDYRGRWV